ncbi:hypothetical protein [Novilysobacter antarcticus]|uniref:hypothetical protein n=1 Tax=Novilysobacter antarcticus TaxID=2862543 RepID=UPI001C999B44|nr:hypothetical protein [Lysobacter antarcticus]
MKRYPLATLIRLREHRTQAAQQLVLQHQREVAAKRGACVEIERHIDALGEERGRQRRQLLDPPPPGIAWPAALAQREAHIELLQQQTELAQQQLLRAQQLLTEAEAELQKVREAFFRVKAREDALKKRKDLWREEQHANELRQEEIASAELLHRRTTPIAFH